MSQLTTYKIPYTSEYDFIELRRQYSAGVRLVYNRLLDDGKDNEIRNLFKTEYNLPLLKSFHIANIISEAKGLYKKHNGRKIIFGSKRKLKEYNKGLISKDELKNIRLRNFNICGEWRYKGNRHFVLDIANDRIIFKQDRKHHYVLNISGLSKKRKSTLLQLQHDCLNKKDSFAISVGTNEIKITFEPKKKRIHLKSNRYIGIDLNPTNIGISVCEDGKVLHTQEFNFSGLIDKFIKSKKASDSKETTYLNNKLDYELLEISNIVAKLQKHYQCRFVFIEDLKFKKSNNLSKRVNRLTKNLWKRNNFVSNLTKHIEIIGGRVFQVNPAYSSIIGNLCHSYSDSVNASIEIGRRGYEVIIRKNKKFYPDLTTDSLKNQWKEHLTEDVKSWKELCAKIKNMKLRYRVSLDESDCSGTHYMKSIKSFVDLYLFNGKSIGLNMYIDA